MMTGTRRIAYYPEMNGVFSWGGGAPPSSDQSLISSRPSSDTDAAVSRLSLCGWLLLSDPKLVRLGAKGPQDLLTVLQRELDAGHHSLLNELEGCFSAAYMTPDGVRLCLHRGTSSFFPIYFAARGAEVRWGSDVRSAVGESFDNAPLDLEVLATLLVLDVARPDRSIFLEVDRLPAGCTLWFDRSGRRVIDQEVTRSADNSRLSFADASGVVRDLMSSAVRRMIDEQDNVIVLYSGGLDSSVAAFESRNCGASVTAWTCAFKEIPQLRQSEEHAVASAHALGVRHVMADRSSLLAHDSTYLDTAVTMSIPTDPSVEFLLASSRNNSVNSSVVLSGTVVDALFNFEAIEVHSTHGRRVLNPFRVGGRPWSLSRDVLTACLIGKPPRPSIPPFGDPVLREWLTPFALESASATLQAQVASCTEGYSGPAPSVYRSLHHLVEMSSFGMMSQAHAEAGNIPIDPFLDRELIDFCLSLGPRHRIQHAAGRAVTKPVLRYAYRREFLPKTVQRSMNGPLDVVSHVFLRNHLDHARFLLGKDSILAELGIVAEETLRSILTTVDDPIVARSATTIVRAMAFEGWLRAREKRDALPPKAPRRMVSRSPVVRRKALRSDSLVSSEAVATLLPHVRLVAYDSIHLLIDTRTNFLFRLNASGGAILRAILDSTAWQQCFEETSRELDLAVVNARKEVLRITNDLQGRNMLRLNVPLDSADTAPITAGASPERR